MTREEFIEVLENRGYPYKIEGDKLVVTGDEISLDLLETLPEMVEFRNGEYVDLNSLVKLPASVNFKNVGNIYLYSLKTLPPGVVFRNGGNVNLNSLETIPSNVEFRNRGNVYLKRLTGGWFQDWSGNIEGIDNKRLLNHMISKGVFI